MKNNIFEYATGELSQDAFICWCKIIMTILSQGCRRCLLSL